MWAALQVLEVQLIPVATCPSEHAANSHQMQLAFENDVDFSSLHFILSTWCLCTPLTGVIAVVATAARLSSGIGVLEPKGEKVDELQRDRALEGGGIAEEAAMGHAGEVLELRTVSFCVCVC